MARLELREYQSECLSIIADYCADVRKRALTGALRPERDAFEVVTGRNNYHAPEMFSGAPYFCLRVPTGGGKTLIAAHAVGTIARHLGHTDQPLCLWVTPTTTIRDQTLRGLKDRSHPYSEALREALGANVQVLTIEEAQYASKAMMSSDPIVIVTTIQSYRIDDEGNRKVYQDNGYLMDHFTNLPTWARDRLRQSGNGDENGRVALSLANAMKLRGPIVIMDEAHNARTKVSFESLARFGPLAVLELTATPQQEHDPDREKYASNVLHAVSALQLKNEGMIKLPVELESRSDWLEVLQLTIDRRTGLDAVARDFERQSGRFIRPIAVIQAQPKSKLRETHTAEAVKEKLTDENGPFKLSMDAVRIATGALDEIGDEDLSARDCPVEYIITVDKLREGWDCPFAYVLGSIGNVATETAVEQLLGRVLRMPHAEPTEIPELDRAYAVVQSEDVIRTAKGLRDSLVERCGFDADSVADAFRVHDTTNAQRPMALAAIPFVEQPRLDSLPISLKEKVEYDPNAQVLRIHGSLSRDETIAIRDAAKTLQDQAAVETHWQRERSSGVASKKLDEYADPIIVPRLAVRSGDRIMLFEPEELDEFDWDLDACDPVFDEDDFDLSWRAGDRVEIGVKDSGATQIGSVEQIIVTQLALLSEGEDWSETELVRWLNVELHKGRKFLGLTAAQSAAWFRRAVDYLLCEREADLGILIRKRHALADALIPRVAQHGRQQVRKAAEMLISGAGTSRLETLAEHAMSIEEHKYAPYDTYRGGFTFKKHAFEKIGSMRHGGMEDGEEAQCAKRIDDHPNVKRWIRNLSHESAGGFHLPLSPGQFFPDFICELEDGRIAIVEYKGAMHAERSSELHKKAIGELWAAQSDGHGVFVWVADKDWNALDALAPIA